MNQVYVVYVVIWNMSSGGETSVIDSIHQTEQSANLWKDQLLKMKHIVDVRIIPVKLENLCQDHVEVES